MWLVVKLLASVEDRLTIAVPISRKSWGRTIKSKISWCFTVTTWLLWYAGVSKRLPHCRFRQQSANPRYLLGIVVLLTPVLLRKSFILLLQLFRPKIGEYIYRKT